MELLGGLPSSALTLGGAALAVVVTLVLSFLGVKKASKAAGVAEGKLEAERANNAVVNQQNAAVAAQNAAVVEQVEKVHEVHDRLESDPAYRNSVRDRFTRPDPADTPGA